MNQSEWHEQVDFSALFFKATMWCRTQEANGDLMAWKSALESKITLVMGIFDKEEKEEVHYFKSLIYKAWSRYYNENRKLGEKNMNPLHPVCADFRNTLFLIESQIDTMVNKKMPFLNIKKKVDIRGL